VLHLSYSDFLQGHVLTKQQTATVTKMAVVLFLMKVI